MLARSRKYTHTFVGSFDELFRRFAGAGAAALPLRFMGADGVSLSSAVNKLRRCGTVFPR